MLLCPSWAALRVSKKNIVICQPYQPKLHLGSIYEVQSTLKLRRINNIFSLWLFTDIKRNKIQFDYLNVIVDKLEIIKASYSPTSYELRDYNIIALQHQLVFLQGILYNCSNSPKKKGGKPKPPILETYSDIELSIPKLVQYSALL